MSVDAIKLPPKPVTLLRRSGHHRLSPQDLKQPLKACERFHLTLIFEHAGS